MFTFARTVPILRSFDERKAKEFYVGFLGFTVDFEHRFGENFPLYFSCSRAGLTFHISEHYGDAIPGAGFFVEMTGLREFHAELAAKEYRYYRPGLSEAFWGALVMPVIDPFGNRIRFEERLPAASA